MLAVLHDNFVLAKLVLILLEFREGILVVLLALLKAIMVYVRFYDTYAFMIFPIPVVVERNKRPL